MCRALDDLKDFDRYEANLLPLLRRAVDDGWSIRRIRKELATFSQALVIQQGLCGNINRSCQVNAIKDVLDRHEGWPARRSKKNSDSTKLTKAELVELAYQLLSKLGRSE